MPKDETSRLENIEDTIGRFQSTDIESLKQCFLSHLQYSLAKDQYSATKHDLYKALALTVRDKLTERWITTQQSYYKHHAKRVYYLSMEFLIGRSLGNALINLGLQDQILQALRELNLDMDELSEMESDAGLGNGGLGRLAACFMDSMATLELPAYGYGIKYEYGIFTQEIKDGFQVEKPDNWLRYGNMWEFERPEFLYPVHYYGKVNQFYDDNNVLKTEWVDTKKIMAMAYDFPIPGYGNNTVNNMRLWSAKATRDFDFDYFNTGDYEKAVGDKVQSETVSKVLYPNDNVNLGRELRLKQEYFFVSATLQDIIRRFKKEYTDFAEFPEKVAIQLNDTHPAIAIPELMRILVDLEGYAWEKAWSIVVKTFGYTNHTVMPEALERWSVHLFEEILPRHLQIIYEINFRFLQSVSKKYQNNLEKLKSMSIIEEGTEKKIRMANLSIVGSHSVNGVAKLHSDILKHSVFKDFYEEWPERFNNKTNGITQRRWLKLCNPELSALIGETIGDKWITNLFELKQLEKYAKDPAFQAKWDAVKRANKERLASFIKTHYSTDVDPDSIFDIQVKRIHEYKRQLLDVLHVITLYNRIKNRSESNPVPRTVIFAGKAAPGYYAAKLIIKLINSVAETVNNDPDVGKYLKIVFLENYSVSLAQRIMPAADLSEQISTAGNEASGTGNMKFSLNGALTIGTLDGANIEIMEEVGRENIFIFGLTSDEVRELQAKGYNPWDYFHRDEDLRRVLDMINDGFFAKTKIYQFRPVIESLLDLGDKYMLLADYRPYIECQAAVEKTYTDRKRWIEMSIRNVANMGKFSTDRTIAEYANEIWNVKPVKIEIGKNKG